jgi:protein-tyrosine phosphatase
MSYIVKNLYLGDIDDVNSKKFITENNIKLIINAAVEVKVPFYDTVSIVMNLQWYDALNQPIEFSFLDKLSDVIDNFLKEDKGVLVNCFAGISRSSTIVIAYMMNKHNMSFKRAYNYVVDQRIIVIPNPSFKNILKNYEIYLEENKKGIS